MVSPLKMPSISLPPLVMRKIFGSGRGGVKVSSRSTARGERIRTPWAPSPPSAFCQEKVTTSSRSQSRACAKTAEVASQKARPSRPGASQSAPGTRTPEVVPFQVKQTSASGRMAVRSGSSP